MELLDPLAAITGTVLAAAVVVSFPTPSKLSGFIEESNAFNSSDLQFAAIVDLAEVVMTGGLHASDVISEVTAEGAGLAGEAGTGEVSAAKKRAVASLISLLCVIYSPVRSFPDSGLSSISSGYSIQRGVSISCAALAA